MSEPTSSEADYRAFFREVYPDLLRFAQRRVEPSEAEEVAAEAMLIVWRRFDRAPREPSDRRAWTFGVARNVLFNTRRSRTRWNALGVRLAAHAVPSTDDHAERVNASVDVRRAWEQLTPSQQETLALTILDGLRANEAAVVLGITAVSYRARLTRARRALRVLLRDDAAAHTTLIERQAQ